MIMEFDIAKTVSFDVDDDLAERVLKFVEFDMWDDHPDKEDYDNLSGKDHKTLIIETLKTALKKYENT